MSRKPVQVFVAVAFLLVASPALAATYYVPDDFTTIQAAVSAAAGGDTVLVRNGTYTENIDFLGKAITVKSVSGAASTVIDGNATASVVTFTSDEGTDSVLEGFTITNGLGSSHTSGNSYGGGIYCDSSSPTITNCVVTANTADFGGAIACRYGSSPTITGCTISGNSADSGAIFCENTSSPNITDCTISGNRSRNGGAIFCTLFSVPALSNCTISDNLADLDPEYGSGGAIFCQDAYFTITNCTISGNSARLDGGAVWLLYGMPVIGDCVISDSVFSNNSAEQIGGAICCAQGASPTINRCTISGNSAGNFGGGIVCWMSGASPTITNCTITGNSSVLGGGLACLYGGTPTIISCTFSGNSASHGGGAIYDDETTIVAKNNILWGDTASVVGSEVYLYKASFDITYSDIQGGWAGTGNINANPLFLGGGNYHLASGSPCIDSGIDAGIYTDIDGDVRPQGAGYDMGSDEYVGGQAQLTYINLTSPADQTTLTSPPTFTWTPNGGSDNIFAVDIFLAPSGPFFSTYNNLHKIIRDESWTMPQALWKKIPTNGRVYWRVRGVDRSKTPKTIIKSPTWSFYKK